MKISLFFVGELHDNGFNASALAGVEAERSNERYEIQIVSGVPYDEKIMAERLANTADHSDIVIFIGGQGDIVTPQIAERYPDKRFVVIQGSVWGPNLFSYEVKQEQSAFLAGVFAANYTKTGVIGHLSGHRVKPGLKGRAAFVAGVKFANKNISILTSFCGTQDDNAISKAWANAQISDGADVIFTMLNGAREGVIDACRTAGIHQIGNAMDWCTKVPDVFVASAIARIDIAVRRAINDAEAGISYTKKVEIGLNNGDAVCLTLGSEISDEIRRKIATVKKILKAQEYKIPETYGGPEYQVK